MIHTVGVVSKFMSNPGEEHWKEVKWIFKYLRSTIDIGLVFNNKAVMLNGFCDVDLGL